MNRFLDPYERKARLLPASIVVLPLPIAALAFAPWHESLGWSAGLGATVGAGLAYLARAAGQERERRLWASWGGPPTTRWLRPRDTTHSPALKARWRGAIRTLTGLTIPATLKEPGDAAEAAFDRTVGSAIVQLRHRLRGEPAARMVEIHLVDYGFYRNLAGLVPCWVGLAAGGLVAVAGAFPAGGRPFIALGLETLFLIVALVARAVLPGQVKHAAERYAESLLAAAVLVAAEEARAVPPAKPARSTRGAGKSS